MQRFNMAVAVVAAALVGAGGAVAAKLYTQASDANDLFVTFVSSPPGATLVSADSRTVLGVTPASVPYSSPEHWDACASFSGFRARWPDGRQMAVNRIELCPEDGADQEVRFSAPEAAPATEPPGRRLARSMARAGAAERERVAQFVKEVGRQIGAAPVNAPTAPIVTADSPSEPNVRADPPAPLPQSPETIRSAPSTPPRTFAVAVVGRQAHETGYRFIVPGYVSTNSSSYTNCYGSTSGTLDGTVRAHSFGSSLYGSYVGTYRGRTTVDCSGSTQSATTFAPPREVSYSVDGATLSLQLPDGRVAVVNCSSKADWWTLGQRQRRSCRIPMTDRFEAEFNGDKAKLYWRIGVNSEKGLSETYRLIEIVEPIGR